MSPEDLKTQMMAAAEKLIEEMLAKKSQAGQVHLDEIEHLAVEAREAFGAVVASELVKAEAEARREEGTTCPACGGQLVYRGQRERLLVTEAGETRLSRGYYYCGCCGAHHFPPGPSVGPDQQRV
jgi:hypothetical protein